MFTVWTINEATGAQFKVGEFSSFAAAQLKAAARVRGKRSFATAVILNWKNEREYVARGEKP